MHFRHRSGGYGPAVGVRPLARRAAIVVGAATMLASFASTSSAQEFDSRDGAVSPGVPEGRASSTMSLADRLRLYRQRRQKRDASASGVPADAERRSRSAEPSTGPKFAADTPAFDEPPRYTAGRGQVGLSDPGLLSEARSQPTTGPVPPTDAAFLGQSSPPLYVPTQHPNEVIDPGDGPRPASAMIPEAVPLTDTAADPNLLPPPPQQQQQLSTWQTLQQRAVVLQNTYTRGTWLFGGDDKVGMFDAYTQATFAFPVLPGVSFTPSFQTYFLDGPTRTDLPPRLYSIQAEIRSLLPLHQSFVLDLSVIPGVFSDFEHGGSDAFRLQARVIGLYILSPTSQLVFGVLYLDRFDINWLPTGGWIYSPNADWRFELLFPRPKIAMRLSQMPGFARWGYIAGEFGGDAWDVQRTTGATDQLVYRDLRLVVGLEQKYANGRMLFLEAGYVFGRKIEFESERGDFDPGSTGMLRAGLIY